MLALAIAIGGAFLIWEMRNDTEENLGSVVFGRAVWMVLAVLYGGFVVALDSPLAPWGAAIQFAAVCLCLGLIWAPEHPWILQGPGQEIGEGDGQTRPSIWTTIALGLTRGHDQRKIGLLPWLIASFLRYCVSCSLLAFVAMKPLVALAGPLIIAGYWPLAHWVSKSENTKFVAAAWAGFVVYGGLAL